MPRYVVLTHDWPGPHWDLLLEAGSVLKAWRLLAEPVVDHWVPAEPNFDHRIIYLDADGPLSGQRGCVSRWDAGTYEGTLTGSDWQLLFLGPRGALVGEMQPAARRFRFRPA
jgi:hypothetical protein